MSAKNDKVPLRNVVGSTGKKNDAIKNYLRRLLRRKRTSGSKP